MKKVVFVAVVIALVAGIVFGGISSGQTATFGLNSGDNTRQDPANWVEAMRFQCPGTGTLTQLELLFDTTPNGSVRMGVYADSSGAPGSFLLDAGSVAVANGWVSRSGLSLPVSANTYYWLAFDMSAQNGVRYQSGGPAGSHVWRSSAFGALPNPYGSYGSNSNTNQYVMRATYTTVAPTPTPTPTPTPPPPTAVNDSYSVTAGNTLTMGAPGVLGNDTGTSLTASLVTTVSHGSLTVNANGSFSYTPSAGYSGSDSFTYRAYNGVAYSNTATVTIAITPVAANDSYSVAGGNTLTVGAPGVLGNDTGTSLTSSWVTGVSHGFLTAYTNGSFTYTPTAGYSGPDSFTYRAYDGVSYSNTATVTITVTLTGPVAMDDYYTVAPLSTLTVPAPGVLTNDTGTSLTASLVTTVSEGTLALNADGSFTYTPYNAYVATDTFTYRAYNGVSYSNTATVTIAVTPTPTAPSANPLQIAMLRWYQANQSGITFPVGTSPGAVCFDGANIWVANSGSVTKLRASDGSLVGTYNVGNSPNGICFDGANIWVTAGTGSAVVKLRASDGSVLGTYSASCYASGGCGANAICFDGANIWVTTNGFDNIGGVTKLRASDGAVLWAQLVNGGPDTICFDGANIWVGQGQGSTVYVFRASDGSMVNGYAAPRSSGLCFDGANIWATNYETVTEFRASDGTLVGTYAFGDNNLGICFDGANIWVADHTVSTVAKLRASDGSLVGTYNVGNSPHGICFDGANIWVTNGKDNTVTKL